MTIVELLGTKLSPSVDSHRNKQRRHAKSRSQRVELLGTKPLTPVHHMEKRQRDAGAALTVGSRMVDKLDRVVMVKYKKELSLPMRTVTG